MYCFSAQVGYHSHNNWKWEAKNNSGHGCAKKEVLDCLDLVEKDFVYYMKNACYKSLSKSLESFQKWDELDNQTTQFHDENGKNLEPCRRLRCLYSIFLYM